jgi:DNA-cytosine methyltransferase
VPHGDITEIDAGAIPEHDMLTAGFPCQSFSRAGGQAGLNADTGQLFFEVVRVLASSQPRCFLLENVADLERHDGGLTFAVVRAALEGAGAFVRAGGCVCVWVRAGRWLLSAQSRVAQRDTRLHCGGWCNAQAMHCTPK